MYLDGSEIIDGGQAAIINLGDLHKTEAVATVLAIPFTNNGTYHIQGGSVTVSGHFTCFGSVLVGDSASLVS